MEPNKPGQQGQGQSQSGQQNRQGVGQTGAQTNYNSQIPSAQKSFGSRNEDEKEVITPKKDSDLSKKGTDSSRSL